MSTNKCEHYLCRDMSISCDNRFVLGPPPCYYLFTMIMEELTTYIQVEVPQCMLFVDDIALVDESRNDANDAKLETWWQVLESNGFKTSRTNT